MSALLHPATEPPDERRATATWHTADLSTPAVAADAFAARGIPIRLLAPRRKVPYRRASGAGQWSTDRRRIADWFAGRPASNYAIQLGVDTGDGRALYVLDLDPRNYDDAEAERRAELLAALPPTFTVTTPGRGPGERGEHRYFWSTPGLRSKADLPAGFDLLAAGKYAVGPGSVRAAGEYVAADPRHVASVPVVLASMLVMGFDPARREPRRHRLSDGMRRNLDESIDKLLDEVADAAEGNRMQTLNRAAFIIGGWVAAENLADGDRYVARLIGAAQKSGLSLAEVKHRARRSFAAGLAEPLRFGGDDSARGVRGQILETTIAWALSTTGSKLASTDRRVMLAALNASMRAGSFTFGLSHREAAELAGIELKAATRSLHRLTDAGYLHLVERGEQSAGSRHCDGDLSAFRKYMGYEYAKASVWELGTSLDGVPMVPPLPKVETVENPGQSTLFGPQEVTTRMGTFSYLLKGAGGGRLVALASVSEFDLFRDRGVGAVGHEILCVLAALGEPVTVDELAERVGRSRRAVAWPNRDKPAPLMSLHELGLVDFDRDRDSVVLSSKFVGVLGSPERLRSVLAGSALHFDNMAGSSIFGTSIRQAADHRLDRVEFLDNPELEGDDPEVLIEELAAEVRTSITVAEAAPIVARQMSLLDESSVPPKVSLLPTVRDRRREADGVKARRLASLPPPLLDLLDDDDLGDVGPGRCCVACGDPAPPGVRIDWTMCTNTCRGRKKRRRRSTG